VRENLWSRDGRRPLPRDPLQQKLEVAAADPVALHDEADHGIRHQLGERALCDADVYGISLTRDHGFAKSGHMTPPTFPLLQRLRNGIPHNRMVA
jgi:hypothetical protein